MKDQKELWLSEHHLEYHRRQFVQPYRSIVHLRQFVSSVLGNCTASYRALDVGCGAGANIFHLSRQLPNTSWVGVDINEDAIELGRKLIAEHGGLGTPLEFLSGDFYHLMDYLPAYSFDLVFCIQTLSWLPEYETLLPQLLGMAKTGGVVFISSLFSDFLVDAYIKITQYKEGEFGNGEGPYFYNVYCLDRFREHCVGLGASQVVVVDFEIDEDLPLPDTRQMGTYTRKLEDGRRLQFSGSLLMPWKLVAVLMGEK
jgi:ubiquinone/menaquinone biosynthesis C-methylase UbiE